MPESSKSEFPLTRLNKDKYVDLDTNMDRDIDMSLDTDGI